MEKHLVYLWGLNSRLQCTLRGKEMKLDGVSAMGERLVERTQDTALAQFDCTLFKSPTKLCNKT